MMTAAVDFPRQAGRALRRQRCRARNFAALVGVWRQRARSRRELMMMTDRELRDLGINRYEALYEARKPFWRA